jgi:flagellar L-ring protein precursor FlgH
MNKPSCSRFNAPRKLNLRTSSPKRSSTTRAKNAKLFQLETWNLEPGTWNFSRYRQLSIALIAAVLFCAPTVLPAQSIWRDDSSVMFSDKRGTGVGDILTIVVQENTTTSKDNKTATSKQSGVDASISSFLYSPAASGLLTKGGQLPAMKFNAKNDYSGGGTIANSERMIARIAVKVVDVLPNKNLVVEGKRETSFSGEKQTVVLRGVVREADVLANNTVFSYNVADATIQIISKGTISDSQRKGWFTRIWDKLTPF